MVFGVQDIPSLAGKVAIITGANTGIGKITAKEMARKGCHLILACRSEEKTTPVIEEIKKETNNENVEFMKLDLSSLKSVNEFVKNFRNKGLPLNILINNAGVMIVPFGLTEDGIESQLATNHFGHFLLTVSLLDIIDKSQPARIVCLTSSMHRSSYSQGFLFDQINDPKVYDPSKAYGQSKLANLLFAKELAKRLEGTQIYVNGVHPGYVATELQRNIGVTYGILGTIFGKIGYSFFALKPFEGSLTSLYAATSPEIEQKNYRGEYFVPIAKTEVPNNQALDKELASKVWDYTEKVLKEKLGDEYQSKL